METVVDNQPVAENTVWKDWCQEFLSSPGEKPNHEQVMTALKLVLLKKVADEDDLKGLKEVLNTQFISKLILDRAQSIGLKIDDFAVAFLGTVVSGNPGTAVMYCHALRWAQLRDGLEEIGLRELVNLFPEGFLNRERLNTLWDRQKDHDKPLGNLLDGIHL